VGKEEESDDVVIGKRMFAWFHNCENFFLCCTGGLEQIGKWVSKYMEEDDVK
jgi:hypothetical protein